MLLRHWLKKGTQRPQDYRDRIPAQDQGDAKQQHHAVIFHQGRQANPQRDKPAQQ